VRGCYAGAAGGGVNVRRQDSDPHPGFRIDKIPIGAGIAGLIFVVGSLAIFLVGVPALWYFLVGAVALGLGFAAFLHLRER